jgi:hypothetical protein
MTAQMTEWYPPEIKPVRVGRYQTDMYVGAVWSYWDGYDWREHETGRVMLFQGRCWRGLAADPAVTK